MIFSGVLGSQVSYPSKVPDISLHANPVLLYLVINEGGSGFDRVYITGRVKNTQILSNIELGREFQLYERAEIAIIEDGGPPVTTPYTVTTPLSSTPLNTESFVLGLTVPFLLASSLTGTINYAGTNVKYVVGYKFLTQVQLSTVLGLADCAVNNVTYSHTL